MADGIITNIDKGAIALGDGEFRSETLTFAAADTFVAGTILARLAVVLAITAGAWTRAGTSNGTVTSVTVVEGPIVPIVGSYVLTCIAEAAHGGTFKLVDPNGALVADNLVLTAGAGVATVFEVGGLRFTLTDGAEDFDIGDTVPLPVVANGKLVPFNPAGAGGAQRPLAVLTDSYTRSSGGDLSVEALFKGKVNKNRLIIDVDGDGDNISSSILDQLAAAGIFAQPVKQLSTLDNQ